MKKLVTETNVKALKERLDENCESVQKLVEKKEYPVYMTDFVMDSFARILADLLKWSAMSGIVVNINYSD